jgi:hypothetical protein
MGAIAAAPVIHRQRGIVRIETAITCDASGVLSEVVVGNAVGRLVGVFYDGGLDVSATVTVKCIPGGSSVSVPVLAYTTGTEGTPVYFRPTDVATTNAGADLTVGAGVAVNINRDIYVAGKLTLTVAGGGVSETAKWAMVIDEADLGEPGSFYG